MKQIFKKYFALNTWMVFLILLCIYSIALTIEFNYVFTDKVYYNSLASKRGIEGLNYFISADRALEWLNYPISILIILLPSLFVGFCLNLGLVINGYKISFSKLFGLALKAQAIFAINYLVGIILKALDILSYTYETANNNYDFQSALIFFNIKNLPYWLYYPLQNINITEVTHFFFLSLGFSWLMQIKLNKALQFVFLWYGIGLLFWIVFTVFLQTLLYN